MSAQNPAQNLARLTPATSPARPPKWAVLFGMAPPPARHAAAPVRTFRMPTDPAKLRDLPPLTSVHPDALRTRRERENILRVLGEHGGAMRRVEIAAATGLQEETVGERLSEMKKLGVVQMERVGRTVMWEPATEGDDE